MRLQQTSEVVPAKIRVHMRTHDFTMEGVHRGGGSEIF